MNADAGSIEFEAAPVVAVTIIAIVVAMEALAHQLVAIALLEAARTAEVVAADLAAHARDRLHQPQRVGFVAQAHPRASARLAERRARKRDGGYRQQKNMSHCRAPWFLSRAL